MSDMEIKVGDPISWDCRRVDTDGNAVAISGTPIASQLRHPVYPSESLTLTATEGTGENFTLTATKAQTLAMRPGFYNWDIEFGDGTSEDGSTDTYEVFVKPDNTTPAE